MKKLTLILLSLIVVSSTLTIGFQPSAVDAQSVEFDKNFLIDDDLFIDSDSMTLAEIQSFLEAEGSLLANWVDDIDMRRPSDNCIVHHATNMTAAEIIYEASTAWNSQVYDSNGCAIEGAYWGDAGYSNYTLQTVSPKAMLVMLQKEQSLVTADGTYSSNFVDYQDPNCCASNEYKLARAMGYGVPTYGSINEKYLGFYNQVNWGAWQLRYNFERAGGNTEWDGVGYITYTGPFTEGVRRACTTCSEITRSGFFPIDGSPLYMDNRATASLYYYTPHTYPGFFGNYNFVQFYNDWFGSTLNPQFKSALDVMGATRTVATGDKALTFIKLTNTGNTTWYDVNGIADAPEGTSPTRLITTKPVLRSSNFGNHWGPDRNVLNDTFGTVTTSTGSLAANQGIVRPGHSVKINFFLGTSDRSLDSGTYNEWVRLANEDGTIIDGFYGVPVKLVAPEPDARLHSQQSARTLQAGGDSRLTWIKFKNTGNTTWHDADSIESAPDNSGPIRLITTKSVLRSSDFGFHWGDDRNELNDSFGTVYNADGVTPASNQDVVYPGQVARFNFFLRADNPSQASGSYSEWVRLAETGYQIIDDPVRVPLNVIGRDAEASFVSQGATRTLVGGGDSKLNWIRLENTGNTTWYDSDSIGSAPSGNGEINLITTSPVLRSSIFGFHWGPNRNILNTRFGTVYNSNGSISSNQDVVKPGQQVKINYFLRADAQVLSPGTYTERIRLNEVGIGIIDPLVKVTVRVTN